MDAQEYLANQELLAGSTRRANLQNTLAAVAAMSNNAGAAAAAKMAAADQQRQYAPKQLGNQGFMLPDTGAFVPSKIYTDEREAAREEKKATLAATLAARQEQQTRDLAARSERDANQRALMLTIANMRSGDARYRVDNAPTKAAPAGKTLPAPTINKLSEADGLTAGFADLTAGFQDSYGGGYGTMGVQNFLGKNVPNSKFADQSNWWQGYNDQKNLIRNKLFGSALTASEKKAFDDANITEGMTALQIRTKLAQQSEAAVRARNKLINNYKGSGYDTSGFEEMAVPDAPVPGGRAVSGRVTETPLSAAEQAELAALRAKLGKK